MTELSRRAVLRAGGAVAGAGLLTGCTTLDRAASAAVPTASAMAIGSGRGFVGPHDASVLAAESVRRAPGAGNAAAMLMAGAGRVDLGGRVVDTWSYGGQVPAREIRVKPGEVLTAVLGNRLPQPTTVHWHGVDLYYPMDGSPDISQPQVRPGSSFTYRFTVPDTPGTFWFHPHVGVQQDHGLYGALIIEDPHEPLAYDHDWTVVIDDWIDGVKIGGVTATPDAVLATLRKGMSGMSGSGMGGSASGGNSATVPGAMLSGARSPLLGGDAGDIRYPFYLINGRLPSAPVTGTAKPGDRVRIRLINAGGDTAFRVALGGHRMRVVAADGRPVQPVETGAVLLGMAERYDVIVTLGDGVFPLVAAAEGKGGAALALVRTASGTAPGPTVRPAELHGHVLDYAQLRPADSVRLASRPVDRVLKLTLNGGMTRYNWAINGQQYTAGDIGYAIRHGERIRLIYANTTSMWHPMHLHGHAFALRDGTGPRKDTVAVLPHQTVTVQFDADNPGRWMTHCHNVYHEAAGMMAAIGYLR
jgi:FtsP/CotA-like multicopper oxidase with cupredoxin domain